MTPFNSVQTKESMISTIKINYPILRKIWTLVITRTQRDEKRSGERGSTKDCSTARQPGTPDKGLTERGTITLERRVKSRRCIHSKVPN